MSQEINKKDKIDADTIIVISILIVQIVFSFFIFDNLAQIIIFFVIDVIYFLPFYISAYRDHPNSVAIFLLNTFLGWTLIGWVISIVWASLKLGNRNG